MSHISWTTTHKHLLQWSWQDRFLTVWGSHKSTETFCCSRGSLKILIIFYPSYPIGILHNLFKRIFGILLDESRISLANNFQRRGCFVMDISDITIRKKFLNSQIKIFNFELFTWKISDLLALPDFVYSFPNFWLQISIISDVDCKERSNKKRLQMKSSKSSKSWRNKNLSIWSKEI